MSNYLETSLYLNILFNAVSVDVVKDIISQLLLCA